MHIMYVDESGDPGIHQHSSPHYILSGLIVNEDEWTKYLQRLKEFRKYIKAQYNLNQRTEIHAAELIRVGKLTEYGTIRKNDRISILKDYASQIPIIFDTAKVINICFDKARHIQSTSVQEKAWSRLIQRFDIHLKRDVGDKGIIIADDTDGKLVMNLLRKMRVYNPVQSHYTAGSYSALTDNIIEDVLQRSSHHSYFIQTVDVIAHLLYRREFPKGSLKKYSMEHLFDRIAPILLTEASKTDKLGIVRK